MARAALYARYSSESQSKASIEDRYRLTPPFFVAYSIGLSSAAWMRWDIEELPSCDGTW